MVTLNAREKLAAQRLVPRVHHGTAFGRPARGAAGRCCTRSQDEPNGPDPTHESPRNASVRTSIRASHNAAQDSTLPFHNRDRMQVPNGGFMTECAASDGRQGTPTPSSP